MTTIERVLAVPGSGAGYYEDLAALQAASVPLPQRFEATPLTPGFRAVREAAEVVSVGLVLDDGQVAWGDCVAVSYSGQAGRWPVFRSDDGLVTIREVVTPALVGRPLVGFRQLTAEIDALTLPPPPPESAVADPTRRAILTALPRAFQEHPLPRSPNARLHPAVRYGVSQALLQAVALARGVTMAEVIADEWGLPRPNAPVPIHAQSGSERYYNAEKMIARRVASLPHGLVDDLPGQLGADGSEMTRYIRWLSKRIGELGGESYQPTIHLDLHGALGRIYAAKPGPMLGQLYAWELAAQPYALRIESPVLLESRAAQIEAMKTLRQYVRLRHIKVRLVADEWANTFEDIQAFLEAEAADMIQIKMPDLGSIHHSVEAVLACKAGGVSAFLGGSYAETDLAARASVHVALATRPEMLMAKPGLGVDEAISLVENEMVRTLVLTVET